MSFNDTHEYDQDLPPIVPLDKKLVTKSVWQAEVDSLRTQLSQLTAEAEKLRGMLDNEGKKIRWLWSDREYAIEDVESDCENADYSLGSINVVRYAVAVEIPDEWYVWWEDNADSARPDVQQLWGPFKTKEEADVQKATLEARQADAATGKTEGGK
jgi:hypothetical protein